MKMSVRAKWLVALGVFAIGCSGLACAQESPQVELTVPSDPALAQRGIVTFSISNPTDERVAFLSIETPFANDGDHLANVEFKVTDPSGRDVAYQGRNVNFGRPDSSAFIILEPHQTLTKNVDIVREYGLSEGGAYTITYEKAVHVMRGADTNHLDTAKPFPVDDVPGQDTRSNTLRFYVNGAFIRSRRTAAQHHVVTSGAIASSCTASQSATLSADVLAATAQAYAALNHLAENYTWDYDANNVPQHGHVSDPRYIYWFGAYDSSILLSDPSWDQSDNAHVDKVVAATWYRLSSGLLSFDCGCPNYPSSTRAWAETGSPYLVHVCDAYWTDPPTGGSPAASRVGTLVHESSHFSDVLAAGTGDTYYLSADAHKAAVSARSTAVRTAVNYEYFIMDATRR